MSAILAEEAAMNHTIPDLIAFLNELKVIITKGRDLDYQTVGSLKSGLGALNREVSEIKTSMAKLASDDTVSIDDLISKNASHLSRLAELEKNIEEQVRLIKVAESRLVIPEDTEDEMSLIDDVISRLPQYIDNPELSDESDLTKVKTGPAPSSKLPAKRRRKAPGRKKAPAKMTVVPDGNSEEETVESSGTFDIHSLSRFELLLLAASRCVNNFTSKMVAEKTAEWGRPIQVKEVTKVIRSHINSSNRADRKMSDVGGKTAQKARSIYLFRLTPRGLREIAQHYSSVNLE